MSNYSRSFDEQDGGGGGFGRRGGRGGRFNSAPQTFDGKHQRKPVVRKNVDYNALLMKQESERMYYRNYKDRPMLEPVSDSIRDLPAMVEDVAHNPAMGICTKYIALSVNKTRCPITALAWAPDGRRLLTGSSTGEFTQWNGLQFNFEAIVQLAHEEAIRAMTWAHNDVLLLTADDAGIIKYWQPTLNNLKAFKAHKEPVRDLSFSPNDLHFVSCSDDQTASIWDLETSKEVLCLKGHGWDVKASKWHPTKGVILTGSKDQLIKLWDPRAGAGGNNHGKNEHCLADLHAHKNTVNRLAWNPTNPYWFLSGARDNLVKIFDIRTMKDFQTFRAHKKEISSLCWHPSIERLFASGSYDGAIHQWIVGEPETQGEITGAHDSAVYGLEYHPLGHLLASASNDHTTRFWARTRPGDEMTDKYNVSQLPDEKRVEAVASLVEAAQKNPSKYGRLPAALAQIAEQSAAGQAEADAAAAAAGSSSFRTSESLPGMGFGHNAPRGMKKEEGSSYSSSYGSRDRKRSRSRSPGRDEDKYRSGGNDRSAHPQPQGSRYAPSATPGSNAAPAGYNAFFSNEPVQKLQAPPPPQNHPPPTTSSAASYQSYPTSSFTHPDRMAQVPSSYPAPPPSQQHGSYPPPPPQGYSHPPYPHGGPPPSHLPPPPPPPSQQHHHQQYPPPPNNYRR